MANALNQLAVVDLREPGVNPHYPPTYVEGKTLAANTAKSIAVPANAAYARIAVTADTYVAYQLTGGAVATAVVPVDTSDGTSNELIKASDVAQWRVVSNVISISAITAAGGGGIITVSFFGR